MDLFFLKKLISAFLLPMPLFFLLAIPGLVLLWTGKGQKAGKLLITGGIVWLGLFSWGPVPGLLLEPLEKAHPAFDSKGSRTDKKIDYIVVLGGYHVSDPDVPPTGRISGDSLARLAEAITIYRKTPGAKLILSGWANVDPVSNARVMAGIAKTLGVLEKDILLEERPRDTKDEAKLISGRVGKKPFYLVTSAGHMPRSVALFQKQGANPIAVPTAHRIKTIKNAKHWSNWFPKANNIRNAEDAFHEILGILWARIRGQI